MADDKIEPKAKSKAKAKAKPLTRNTFTGGAWYGPAWGNAEDYPVSLSPDTHPHLFAED